MTVSASSIPALIPMDHRSGSSRLLICGERHLARKEQY